MNERNLTQTIQAFIKKIDPKSWPAFFMFLVVLSAAGGLNYVGMEPVFGWFIAIAVACFFGVGVLSWHVVESRTDDSEYQEQVAQFAKWGTVVLDGLLLMVNLVRAELRYESASATRWDIGAYVIIGLSAAIHVVGFLLWTQASPRRALDRDNQRKMSKIDELDQKSKHIIARTEKKLKVHKWVADEEKRLRQEYADLEPEKVNRLVNKMRQDAYAMLDDTDGSVVNGQHNTPKRPQEAPRAPQKAYAEETEQVKPEPDPQQGRGS